MTMKPACVALRECSQVYKSPNEDEDEPDGLMPLPFEGNALGEYNDDY